MNAAAYSRKTAKNNRIPRSSVDFFGTKLAPSVTDWTSQKRFRSFGAKTLVLSDISSDDSLEEEIVFTRTTVNKLNVAFNYMCSTSLRLASIILEIFYTQVGL